MMIETTNNPQQTPYKRFWNSFVYEESGGLYLCEWVNRTFKDHAERMAEWEKLHDEIDSIVKELGIKCVPDEDGSDPGEDGIIWLSEEDGKRLNDALLSRGWKREFIPFGP